jgi:hypothetical protein
MSAGIVSACLPTLRPVILIAGRALGLKGSIFRSTNASTGASNLNSTNALSAVRKPRTQNGDFDSKADGGKDGGPFYRLPDDGLSTGSGHTMDKLRPDMGGYEYSVSTSTGLGGVPIQKSKGDGDSFSSGDEIPLQGIRVETDFKHTSTPSQ